MAARLAQLNGLPVEPRPQASAQTGETSPGGGRGSNLPPCQGGPRQPGRQARLRLGGVRGGDVHHRPGVVPGHRATAAGAEGVGARGGRGGGRAGGGPRRGGGGAAVGGGVQAEAAAVRGEDLRGKREAELLRLQRTETVGGGASQTDQNAEVGTNTDAISTRQQFQDTIPSPNIGWSVNPGHPQQPAAGHILNLTNPPGRPWSTLECLGSHALPPPPRQAPIFKPKKLSI